jgi:hypothetical protein
MQGTSNKSKTACDENHHFPNISFKSFCIIHSLFYTALHYNVCTSVKLSP